MYKITTLMDILVKPSKFFVSYTNSLNKPSECLFVLILDDIARYFRDVDADVDCDSMPIPHMCLANVLADNGQIVTTGKVKVPGLDQFDRALTSYPSWREIQTLRLKVDGMGWGGLPPTVSARQSY